MKKLSYLITGVFFLLVSLQVGAQTCNYEISLWDSWGDGWDGFGGTNVLDVSVNGSVVLDDIFVSGSLEAVFNFPVTVGDNITITWFSAGNFPGENAWQLRDAAGNIVQTEGGAYGLGPGSGGAPPALVDGAPVGPFAVTSCPSCSSPSGMTASTVSSTEVSLAWTAGGSETVWDIEYYQAGVGSFTGTPTAGFNNVTNNTTLPITGLTAGVDYELWYRADCAAGGGAGQSSWAGPVTFSIDPGDNCSLAIDLALETSPYSGTTTGANNDFPSTNCSGATNSTAPDLIFFIDILANETFNFAQTVNAYDSKVFVSYGPSCPGDFVANEIFCADDPDIFSSSWTNTTGATQRVYYIQSGFGSSNGTFTIEWSVDPAPACPDPNTLAANAITESSAEISWNAGGTETEWDVYYGAAPLAAPDEFTNPTEDNTTNNVNYPLSGLSSATEYEFYVRADCAPGDSSDWVGPLAFTTPCPTFTLPYVEDFEGTGLSSGSNYSDACWTTVDNGLYDWEISVGGLGTGSFGTGPAIGSNGDDFVFAEASSGSSGNVAELISPQIDLPVGSAPLFSFDYHMFGADVNQLAVDIDAGGGFVNLTTIVGQQQTAEGDAWITEGLDLCAYAGNVVTLRFSATRGASFEGDIAIDNVRVEDFSCPTVQSITVSNILDVSADVTWEVGSAPACATAVDYTVDVQDAGVSIGAPYPLTVTGTSASLTGLTLGTEYAVIVAPVCNPALGNQQNFQTLNCLPGDRCSYTLTLFENGDNGINFDGWVTGAAIRASTGGNSADYTIAPDTYFGPEAQAFTILACPGDSLTFELIGSFQNSGETWSVSGPGGLSYNPVDPTQPLVIGSACPTCVPASSLSATNICEGSVTLNWLDPGTPYDSVEVSWSRSIFGFPTAGESSGIIVGNPSSYTFAAVNDFGLDPITFGLNSNAPNWPSNTQIDYSIIGYCGAELSQATGSFTTPDCACAEQCSYTVTVADDFGDGWDSNDGADFDEYIRVLIDGTPVDSVTPISSAGFGPDQITVGTCPGANIEFEYVSAGDNFSSEVIYNISSSIAGTLVDVTAGTFANGTDLNGTIFSESACPSCIAPSGLAAINLAADSARIVWNDLSGEGNATYTVVPTGDDPLTGTWASVSDTTFLATGLMDNTTYDAYVASVCSLDNSDTVSVSFTTPCGAFTAPFTESFDGLVLPDCWEQSATTGGPWVFVGTSPGSPFCSGGNAPNSGAGMAAIDMSGADGNVTLVTPVIDVSGLTTPQLTFAQFSCNTNDGAINTIDVEAADGLGGWVSVTTVAQLTTGWGLVIEDLSGFTYGAGLVQIRFRVNDSAIGSAFYNDVHIDDVTIQETPACPAPFALNASSITETTADLGWTAGGSETVWDLHIVTAGSPAPAEADPGNTPDETTNPYAFSGAGDTDYEFYVRAQCALNDTSAWVGPFAFSTLGLLETYCNGGPTSTADSNLDSLLISGDGASEIFYDNSSCPGTLGSQDLLSESVDLTAGNSYTLEVWAGSCGGSFTNGVEAWIDFDANGVFDPSESLGYNGPASPPFLATINFTVPATAITGPTVMRVNQQETGEPLDPCASYSWGSSLNFTVNLTGAPCATPSALDVDITSETTADLNWTENGTATVWSVEFGEGGTQGDAGNDTIAVSGTPATSLSGLVGGTTYYFWVQSDCGTDSSDWSARFEWVQPVVGATCDLPIVITSIPYNSDSLNTVNYGDDYSTSPCSGSYMGGDDVVFSYTPSVDTCITVTFDAKTPWLGLHILDGCPDDAGTTCLVPDGAGPNNDDLFASTVNIREVSTLFLTGGTEYFFVVSTFPAPQSGAFELSLGGCPACLPLTGFGGQVTPPDGYQIWWESNNIGANYEYSYALDIADVFTASEVGSGTGGPTDGTDTVTVGGLAGLTQYFIGITENCGVDGNSDTLLLTFTTPIANDDCADAETIACGDLVVGNTTTAAPSTLGAGNFTGSNEAARDVWYTFVGQNSDDLGALVGTPGDQVTLSTCNDGGATPGNAVYDTKIDVYTGSCGAPTFIGGNDDGVGCSGFSSFFSFPTTVGETYYVRVYGFNGGSAGAFAMSVQCDPPCLPVPLNDDCSAPEALALETFGTGAYTVGTNACASAETFNPTCAAFTTPIGVWYEFTTDASGEIYFSIDTLSADEMNYSIFEVAPCDGTPVETVCVGSSFGPGVTGVVDQFYTLNPSTSYKLLVYTEVIEGTFRLRVTGPPPPPVNDECAGAELLTVGTDCSSPVAGTLLSATETASPAVSGECGPQINGVNDVWYKAVIPASGRVVIDFPTQPGSNMYTELYTGSNCSLTYLSSSCSAINPKIYPLPGADISEQLTGGDTLYIRVWDQLNDDEGPFEICIYDPVPANNDCSAATTVPVTEFGVNAFVNASTEFSWSGNDCTGGNNADEQVWFEFTPDESSAVIQAGILPGSGNDYDPVIQVLDACGGTILGCFDNYGAGQLERAYVTGLTPGNTYVYSVHHLGGAQDASDQAFRTAVKTFADVQLRAQDCGATGLVLEQSIYSERDDFGEIYVNPAVPVKGYGFRFQEQGGGTDVFTQNNATDGFYQQLDDVPAPGLEYGKTYDVTVQHKVRFLANGSLQEEWSDYGPVCTISLGNSPTTSLQPQYCTGLDEYFLADQLQATPVVGGDAYRFTFDGGGDNYVYESANYAVSLFQVGSGALQYGVSYVVTVEVLANGTWGPPGPPCTIFMATQPENTQVSASFCNGSYLYPFSDFILADQVLGATAYEFRFDNGVETLMEVKAGVSFFFHTTDLIFTPGIYTVDVRAFAGGQWSDFVNACPITILPAPEVGGGSSDDVADGSDVRSVGIADISLNMYPNPNSGDAVFVNLSGMSDDAQRIRVEVIDLTGKVVHYDEIGNNGSEANFIMEFAEPLSKGMYFVNLYVDDSMMVEKLTVE